MFQEYFFVFLTGHILGDFYFKVPAAAKGKNIHIKEFLINSTLYTVSMLLPCIIFLSKPLAIAAAILSGIHLLISVAKYFYLRKQNIKKDCSVFCVEQSLHFLLIIIVSCCMVYLQYSIQLSETAKKFLTILSLDYIPFLRIFILILINARPFNILIKLFLEKFKPAPAQAASSASAKNNPKTGAGALIGTLERWIILLLFCIEQYQLIGFILTAKSIARYKQLEDACFAEYYLLGTLLSSICAILSCLLLFKVI